MVFQLKKYVLEIWKTGSFSQAADNLYVSQPSLSASVKRLEKRIGEPLFDRSTHPVRLTQCGEAYIKAALSMVAAEEDFQAFLDQYGNCQTGTLTLGGSNLNISIILPPLLRKFRERYPNIRLELLEGNIDDLKQQLAEGKLDFVVDSCDSEPERFTEYLYQPEQLLVAVPGSFACNEALTSYQLRREDVLKDRHISKQTQALPLGRLKDVPFILPTRETDTYKRSMLLCQKADFVPNVVLSLHQQASVYHINCAGMGAAFISDALIKNTFSAPDMVYYKVDGKESSRYIKFFKKKEKKMSRAMQAFLDVALA